MVTVGGEGGIQIFNCPFQVESLRRTAPLGAAAVGAAPGELQNQQMMIWWVSVPKNQILGYVLHLL